MRVLVAYTLWIETFYAVWVPVKMIYWYLYLIPAWLPVKTINLFRSINLSQYFRVCVSMCTCHGLHLPVLCPAWVSNEVCDIAFCLFRLEAHCASIDVLFFFLYLSLNWSLYFIRLCVRWWSVLLWFREIIGLIHRHFIRSFVYLWLTPITWFSCLPVCSSLVLLFCVFAINYYLVFLPAYQSRYVYPSK